MYYFRFIFKTVYAALYVFDFFLYFLLHFLLLLYNRIQLLRDSPNIVRDSLQAFDYSFHLCMTVLEVLNISLKDSYSCL
ncbi:hypothetical protein ASF71_10020 [Deinococcus sp. Leaf326]|nr:hypothetical protein ASF71_10020 [Deinococcus sp. Leaf326]